MQKYNQPIRVPLFQYNSNCTQQGRRDSPLRAMHRLAPLLLPLLPFLLGSLPTPAAGAAAPPPLAGAGHDPRLHGALTDALVRLPRGPLAAGAGAGAGRARRARAPAPALAPRAAR